MEFFEKYRLQNVGPTRARLAELIALFDERRKELSIEQLERLRAEIDELTDRLQAERELEESPSFEGQRPPGSRLG